MANFSCFFILHIFHGILCNQCIVLQLFFSSKFQEPYNVSSVDELNLVEGVVHVQESVYSREYY